MHSDPYIRSDPYGSRDDDEVTRCCADVNVAQSAINSALSSTFLSQAMVTQSKEIESTGTNWVDKIGEEMSRRIGNLSAPCLLCPQEYFSQLMVMMPDLEPSDLVARVATFFSQHDMPALYEHFCAKQWEVTYLCATSCSYRVVFYAVPTIHGSCVELHRDSGCSIFVVDVQIALRAWLDGDAVSFPDYRSECFPCDNTCDWDWLDYKDIDMCLVTELAGQQNALDLAVLREKLRPKMQSIIIQTSPSDTRILIDLLTALLQDNTDYLEAPDIISLSEVAARTPSTDRHRLAATFGMITSPIPMEAIARLRECNILLPSIGRMDDGFALLKS